MTPVEQLEQKIAMLHPDEFVQLREWLIEQDWDEWDRQIERDSAAGKADGLRKRALHKRTTISRQPTPELVRFVASIAHDMGHLVASIRNRADSLLHGDLARRQVVEAATEIAEDADRLAGGLQMMRYLGEDEESDSCDFVVAILQPVTLFMSQGVISLRVDATTHDVPRVQVRPGSARRAVGGLLSAFGPATISCTADVEPNAVAFRLTVHPKVDDFDKLLPSSVFLSLRSAGIICKAEPRQPGHNFRVTLRMARTDS